MSAFVRDRAGHLWVTTSAATDHRADGLYLVRKRGARPVKVAGGLDGPLGLTWFGGKLYVASIGRVEAFSGLRGNRFAKRETILSGPAPTASNNAILVAPGGRLLMSVSTTCDHCRPASSWAATIVSFRPDGSDLRLYATGIRAGFGLAFDPVTSDLLVTMNQRDDLGSRTPGDWLSVVRQGQNWGFPACYGQGGPACRDVPKPLAALDKHAAAGGVAVVTGRFAGAAEHSAIVAEWQAGKVLTVPLGRSGAASATTLLTGLKNPLPVLATRAGELLVGDWGTGIIYSVARHTAP